MRISATIVSLSTLTIIKAIKLYLDKEQVVGGTSEFTSPKNVDTDIKVAKPVIAINQFWEEIMLRSNILHK